MASLLNRAKQVREQLKEKAEIEAIPLDEREQIYKEIDKAVSSNSLKIRDNTFAFKPVENDFRLPILINGGAFLLIVIVSSLFYIYFNKAETFIVSESEKITSAESALIETLREESKQKLNEKEEELQGIQSRLDEMKRQQETLLLSNDEEISRIEEELRKSYENDLVAERQRLRSEGYSLEAIDERIKELEIQNQIEYENQLNLLKSQFEKEQLAKEKELNDLISLYEADLQEVQAEQVQLENSLQEQLEGERDQALNQLADLDELKKKEDFVLGQIFSLYDAINESLKETDYELAGENLSILKDYLNQDSVSILPLIKYRSDVDQFMIQSLNKLIEIEVDSLEAAIITENPENEESEKLLSTISNMVNEANTLYDSGNLSAARESYLKAIAYIPALDSGYNKLQNIEELEMAKERELFADSLKSGDLAFKSGNYETTIRNYQEALEYLSEDKDSVSTIVNQLVQAGTDMGKNSLEGQSLVTPEDLALINKAKLQEQSRAHLLNELSVLEENFSSADVTEENSTAKLISLLSTKLLVKKVLASDSIREQYPDLHEKLGLYLDAYGREKEKYGRDLALNEILVITEHLSNNSEGADISLITPDEIQQKELFLKFLNNLKSLFEMEQ